MVERFNRTLLMMLAMFAGKNRDDSGPVRLITMLMHLTTSGITRWQYGRAFEWDGQEKRKIFLDGREYFMGTTGGGDVSNRFHFNGGGPDFAFGENNHECTLPMDIGLPKEQIDTTDTITSPYAIPGVVRVML